MEGFRNVPAHDGLSEYYLYEGEIAQSPNDVYICKYAILSNGMKVLVASDSTTDKAAAALCLAVGSLSDPEQLPGLAHFCEHMLSLVRACLEVECCVSP
jgi:insulysin